MYQKTEVLYVLDASGWLHLSQNTAKVVNYKQLEVQQATKLPTRPINCVSQPMFHVALEVWQKCPNMMPLPSSSVPLYFFCFFTYINI